MSENKAGTEYLTSQVHSPPRGLYNPRAPKFDINVLGFIIYNQFTGKINNEFMKNPRTRGININTSYYIQIS